MKLSNWLQSACASKQQNITLATPYRTGSDHVATDGKRLHIQRGLENTGPEMEVRKDYPAYAEMLNILVQGISTQIEINLSPREWKELLKDLRTICKFSSVAGDTYRACKLELTSNRVFKVSITSLLLELTRNIPINSSQGTGPQEEFSAGFNLTYLIDALDLEGIARVIISYFGPRKPIHLDLGNNCSALVMPLRDI